VRPDPFGLCPLHPLFNLLLVHLLFLLPLLLALLLALLSLQPIIPQRPARVHLVQMNSGARVVNSALVYVLRAQSEEERNQTVSERKEEEKISSLALLPPNSLVYFISFYWLIFNTISFFIFYSSFVFILSLCSLLLFLDRYKHTPN
jgi:hypothetical protein